MGITAPRLKGVAAHPIKTSRSGSRRETGIDNRGSSDPSLPPSNPIASTVDHGAPPKALTLG